MNLYDFLIAYHFMQQGNDDLVQRFWDGTLLDEPMENEDEG